jgi:hypothetical protein
MFSSEDFRVESVGDLLMFMPIFIFVAFVFPFLFAAYQLGFVMDKVGWLD